MSIFGVSEERDGSGLTFFDFGKCLYTGIPISLDAAAEEVSNLLCSKFHI